MTLNKICGKPKESQESSIKLKMTSRILKRIEPLKSSQRILKETNRIPRILEEFEKSTRNSLLVPENLE